jgi:hypothetical protein
VFAFPDPIFPTDVNFIHCGSTIHGGILKEHDLCGQQVFDMPTAAQREKYCFVNSIIRAQLICCVLQ